MKQNAFKYGIRLRMFCILSCLAILCSTVATAHAAGYLGPVAVVAAKDGKTLLVACADARQIAVVDPAAGRVLRSIAVPEEPTGMALSPDGTKLYVTCAAVKSTICVIDLASGAVSATIPSGHTAFGPAVSPDGKRLYVCVRFNNYVSVIDLGTQKETARVPMIREPYAAAVTPDGKTLFVLNLLPLDRSDSYDVAATVAAIDTASNQVTPIRLPDGSSSVRGLCMSPDGKYVYVVHILARYQLPTTQLDRGWMNTNAMSIIDAEARKLINTVLLDDVDMGAANPWGVCTTADGKTICVSHGGTHEISVIDQPALIDKLAKSAATDAKAAAKGAKPAVTAADVPNDLAFLAELRRRIHLEGNGPRGLTIIGSKVFATEYFTDTLGIVDLESKALKPVTQIALGPKPQWTVQRQGEMLFNNAEICFQHWQSCESCHPDARVDALNWDLRHGGLGNPKNTRSLLLAHQTGPVMSLGVRASAEAAVRAGITHILFVVRPEEEAKAIDEYLKSLKAVPSPYLVDGKLSPAAQRGRKLFFDPVVGCAGCHPEPIYTDKLLHDVGSAGKYDKPGDKFTVPSLIEVWRTAPYMHDGHYLTIKEVLQKRKHDARGGDISKLSDKDLDDLVEFVLSL